MQTDRRLLTFARAMRHDPAPAEKLLWKLLRGHRLAGFRFRRQHPFPPYIADYYCAVARLVIELDGESHISSEEADRVRQRFLESLGLRVLRFWNPELFEDEDAVIETIYRACISGVSANNQVAHRLTESGQLASHAGSSSPHATGEQTVIVLPGVPHDGR